MLTFNYDQVLKDVKNKNAEIFKLKDKRRFLNALDLRQQWKTKIGNINIKVEQK